MTNYLLTHDPDLPIHITRTSTRYSTSRILGTRTDYLSHYKSCMAASPTSKVTMHIPTSTVLVHMVLDYTVVLVHFTDYTRTRYCRLIAIAR